MTPLDIGIVTGEKAPSLTDDGTALAAELSTRGMDARPVVWSDDETDFEALDAVMFRSCWQYHRDPEAFRNWLDALDSTGVPAFNPTSVVRWNMHKSYLRDLADAGVDIVPTATVPTTSDRGLGTILERRDWREAVVKPAVGTSSAGVWRVSRAAAADGDIRERFAEARADGDLLVQEYLPEIFDGERSLVFFGGEYSHASLRMPAEDDFTANETVEADTPDEHTIATAESALAAARDRFGLDPTALPYARVDGIVRDGEFLLSELELIEPFLGLERSPGAVERFADAVEAALDASNTA
ncbi:MAG: ATP-grasp domain-containing protein [Natronomonas sp.]